MTLRLMRRWDSIRLGGNYSCTCWIKRFLRWMFNTPIDQRFLCRPPTFFSSNQSTFPLSFQIHLFNRRFRTNSFKDSKCWEFARKFPQTNSNTKIGAKKPIKWQTKFESERNENFPRKCASTNRMPVGAFVRLSFFLFPTHVRLSIIQSSTLHDYHDIIALLFYT